MELIEEAAEAALWAFRASVGCGLVGGADLTNKIGEAARRAGDLRAVQRVGADAVWRAGLAAFVGCGVPAKPLRFELWGAREVFSSYRSTP